MKSKDKKKNTLQESMETLNSFTAKIDEIRGRVETPEINAFVSPLCETSLFATTIDKNKDSLTAFAMENRPLTEMLTVPSKWTIDTFMKDSPSLTTIPHDLLDNQFSILSSLENQTCLLAKDYGISPITSVATQISTISSVLSEQAEPLKELIAPSSMLSDLQVFATKTHESIIETGVLSNWKLGLVDSASLMVDRQVDWVSKLCNTAYKDSLFFAPDGFVGFDPKVNVISVLPEDLEFEKTKKGDITPKEALESSSSLNLTERGKALIDKIVAVNNACSRLGKDVLFKYTGATMSASATIGGIVCTTREEFGNLIDSLYKIFYENLERIKKVVTDAVVRNEAVCQCVFRVKHMRTDIYHDNEHGKESSIRKKNKEIGESYMHYVGKPVLSKRDDFLQTQEKLYEEFERMADWLMTVVIERRGN